MSAIGSVGFFSGYNNISSFKKAEKVEKPEKNTETETKKEVPVLSRTIGSPKLSEKASEYYKELQNKYKDMDFVLVSSDKMEEVKKNAQFFGRKDKTVVLIDEEKVERMAEDKDFRQKYESIIDTAHKKLPEIKNALDQMGINAKNYGFSVNDDGTTSFFATLEKSSKAQADRIQHRIEKKRLEAKEQRKEDFEKRIEKAKEDNTKVIEDEEKITIITDSVENLKSAIKSFGLDYFAKSDASVQKEEHDVGTNVDVSL